MAVPRVSDKLAKAFLHTILQEDHPPGQMDWSRLQAKAEEALLELDPEFRAWFEDQLEQFDPEGRR